ncbi:MAG: hypothetical protein NZL87_09110, partial [Thermomicrobium sp.]|nr:hypothetical protein [Thermomicrobium sp.]
MRRRHVLVGLAYAGLLAVSCRSATPTPTPAPTAAIGGPTPTVVSPTPTVGPVMTPGRLVLKPPDLRLQSARGEQTATIGPFFWVLESGFAGETTAPGLVPPSAEPLAVQVGETLRFLLVDGAQPPARVTVAVYPQE